MSDVIHNRESWLHAFARELTPLIRERTGHTPANYKLSCGFPSRGARSSKNRRIGECWNMPDHRHREIFIHPQIGRSLEAAETAAHELLHAALSPGVGHRKPFSQAAKKLGLEGKPTATVAGEELKQRFEEIIERIGQYPHEALPVGGGPRQSTRLLKVMCPVCGYIVRVTLKWLDEAGAPVCPQCSVEMQEADVGEEASDPLFAVDQSVEYKVKPLERKAGDRVTFDPRWSIRMNRTGRYIRWFVMDFGPAVIDGKAVMGPVLPRLTPAENREDAISLMESLRDGTMTYDEIIRKPDDDPDLELEAEDEDAQVEEITWLGEEEDEEQDQPETEDPRFQWEIERGIEIEDIDPETERTRRESWVQQEEQS